MAFQHVTPSSAGYNNSRRGMLKAGLGVAVMAGGINPIAANKQLLSCWKQLAQLRTDVESACWNDAKLGDLCGRQTHLLATAASTPADTVESFRTKARIALDYQHWQEGQDVAWQLLREMVAGRA